MRVKLSPMQREYIHNMNHRYGIKTGATGSGKTYMDILYTIPKRIRERAGKDGLVVFMGNTKGTLQRNIIEPLQAIYTSDLVSNINSENTARVFGEKVYCLGADKINQVSKIQGASFKYVYADELTTWSEDVFTMLKSRLRLPYSCLDGTCNPDGPHHWFKRFLDGDSDIYQQAYTIDDNPFLDPVIVQELKRDYAGTVYYDRFILGKWTAAEGLIYRMFADNPEQFIIDAAPCDENGKSLISFATIGVDFGGNGSATTFNLTGFTAGFKQVITIAEHYRKEIISPTQLEQDFINFVRNCKSRGYRIYSAYCDSAEQTLIAGLRAAALKERLGIEVVNARKGPINDRIRFYCALMGRGQYKIVRDCQHTIDALQTAVWDAKSTTQDKRLDDGKTNIDSLDAMEYAVEPFMSDILALR